MSLFKKLSFVFLALVFTGLAPAEAKSKKAVAAAPAAAAASEGAYHSRWVQVDGTWTNGWQANHDKPVCGHGDHCNCNGHNYCGLAKPGQVVSYWPNGCDGAEWKIKCESELDPAKAKK